MINNQLISVFKGFSGKDMRDLEEFVNSPYHNKNKNVIKLFSLLKQYYPDFPEENITSEAIFKKIFPAEKFKAGTLRMLVFYLTQVVEKFMAVSRLEKEEFTLAEKLVNEYYDRQNPKGVEKGLKEMNEILERTHSHDEVYYNGKYILGFESMSYALMIGHDKYDKTLPYISGEEMINNLTYSYLIKVIRLYNINIMSGKYYNYKFNEKYFEDMIQRFDPAIFTKAPLLNIYYEMVQLSKYGREENFYRLKELLFSNAEILNWNNKLDSCITLINYAVINRIKLEGIDFYRELFELYLFGLDNRLFYVNKELSLGFYIGIVGCALYLKKYSFAKTFIEEKHKELSKENRKPLYYFSMARLEASLGNYDPALSFLARFKSNHLYLRIEARCLHARIYYELKYFDQLENMIDSLRHLVRDDKAIPEEIKLIYINYLKYLNRLLKLSVDADEFEITKLNNDIESEKTVLWKEWLAEKINELKKQSY